jgi:hypothetical protein
LFFAKKYKFCGSALAANLHLGREAWKKNQSRILSVGYEKPYLGA